MRERRRPSALGSDGHLSGWTHPAVQSAPRTGSRGAPLAAQLSGPQGGNRDHLRTQSRAVASGQNRVKGREDEHLVATVYDALAKRHPKSRSRGRQGTPAEVVLRLLILKHVRNWSYCVLEREVRANQDRKS